MKRYLRLWQLAILVGIFALWQVATQPGLLPPIIWENPDRAAFFFGEPVKMFKVIWEWFSGGEIYKHLWVTLQETALAFAIGSALGLGFGLWLGLSPTASALFDPYITAMNAMPRRVRKRAITTPTPRVRRRPSRPRPGELRSARSRGWGP